MENLQVTKLAFPNPERHPIEMNMDLPCSNPNPLGNYEKLVRLLVLVPLFCSAVTAQLTGRSDLHKLMISTLRPLWLLRLTIGATSLIPLISKFKNRQALDSTKKAESFDNTMNLISKSCGTVLLAGTLTGLPLKTFGDYISALGFIAGAIGTGVTLGTRLKARFNRGEAPKSNEVLVTSLSCGFIVGMLLESDFSIVKTYLAPTALSLGLIDSGFGVIFTGFGIASALVTLIP